MAARKVQIEYRLDHQGLFYKIRDEGQGFDWQRELNQLETDQPSLKAHGRGLILTSFYVDLLEFNDIGNEVMLSVFKPEPGV